MRNSKNVSLTRFETPIQWYNKTSVYHLGTQ
jgi:hypothetical protein